MQQHAEVIAIGDELTSGARLDTNSQWLSAQLEQLGIEVRFHTTVGDDLQSNVDAFRIAAGRASLVISTGGLGPTDDDLTRQALSEAAGEPLELDAASLEHIERRFSVRGREMPPKNRIQAMFPRGSRIVPNPHGTAPGIDLTLKIPPQRSARIVALPGVPVEMKEMFHASVAPTLVSPTKQLVIRRHVVKCFGVGESHMEALLPDLIKRGRQPQVGITVHQATISLRITALAESAELCAQQIAHTVQEIHASAGDLVFGEGDEELQDVVVRQLAERGETISTVESSTSGMLALWLGTADPTRQTFHQAEVVPWHSLETEDQVRRAAMAIRQKSGSNFGLAVGTLPQDDGDHPYYFALASESGVISQSSSVAGHPEIWRPRMVKQGLDLLRRETRG